jgi:hypothetical protein
VLSIMPNAGLVGRSSALAGIAPRAVSAINEQLAVARTSPRMTTPLRCWPSGPATTGGLAARGPTARTRRSAGQGRQRRATPCRRGQGRVVESCANATWMSGFGRARGRGARWVVAG